jgi:hypothetical protein
MGRLALAAFFVYVATRPYLHFYLLRFDHSFVVISLLSLMFLGLYTKTSLKHFYRPTLFLLLSVSYTVINTTVKGYTDTTYSSWYLFADSFVVFGVFVGGTRLLNGKKSFLFVLSVISILIATILFIFFEEVIVLGKINRNDYAWDMNVLSLLLAFSVNNRRQRVGAFVIAIMLILTIVMIESRKSFIFEALIMIYLGIGLINDIQFSKYARRLFKILMLSCIVTVLGVFLSVSHLGSRFDGAINLLDFSPESFDGRANFYFTAPIIYEINPLTGIGLRNYLSYSLNHDERLHSEILVQLLENGLMGLCLWTLFYFSLFKKLPTGSRHLAVTMFVIAFLFRWNYNHYLSFLIFGIFISNEKYFNR